MKTGPVGSVSLILLVKYLEIKPQGFVYNLALMASVSFS